MEHSVKINKPTLLALLCTGTILFLFFIECGTSYEIKGDRSLDANCLAYSKEVRDKLTIQGKDAHIIGFQHGKKQGHGMVIINPYTPNWIIIESYTGREFTMKEPFTYELEDYLTELLGGYPEKAWIFD